MDLWEFLVPVLRNHSLARIRVNCGDMVQWMGFYEAVDDSQFSQWLFWSTTDDRHKETKEVILKLSVVSWRDEEGIHRRGLDIGWRSEAHLNDQMLSLKCCTL
ncbi:hypothetical protein NPIL_148121 [Nephila pilipes]|uniref:Uncharacterized protein n=1 Tax=Nephila pilipes TaxID=299642 RepID=A0A8X6MT90_NEPPI|nr:hypothetical protein NPIL_628131 [Nephila pilipes]GFS99494.1 hypothetical protein NPIL_148121 [Nephila pilipes]